MPAISTQTKQSHMYIINGSFLLVERAAHNILTLTDLIYVISNTAVSAKQISSACLYIYADCKRILTLIVESVF